ncbi:hypothetical protein RJT34_06319 [Clitoria ternatea]|uniref:Uncharacterized protein n=1 Tax=Clitoria ternatea TaxID=43366 RepID=A0AAN9K1L9_CLITE
MSIGIMASGVVKFTFFTVLFIVLVVMVAAHEGHHHTSPAEAPSSYASSITYHTMLGRGLFSLLLAFLLIARDRLL